MDLVQAVILFSHKLRAKNVGVTVGNVIDGLQGVSFVDISRMDDFYYLLRSNFVSRKEEISPFDELFRQFWALRKEHGVVPDGPITDEPDQCEEGEESLSPNIPLQDRGSLEEATDERESAANGQDSVPYYSPEEILSRKSFDLLDRAELDAVKESVLSFSKTIAKRESRRWRTCKKGEELDFRRLIRRSMASSGDMIDLKMRRRKQKPMRVVILCDVSGSMDIYGQFFLLFMYGLQVHSSYCETFAFSTRLNHITTLLKRRTLDQALRLLSEHVPDWSGGTNIGGVVRQLLQRYSYLLSPNRTIFLVFSDGWDRGDAKLLDREMAHLKRNVRKLIWLNPLLNSPGYEPICKGMSTCLPYVDHFLPCHNLVSLKNVGNYILS
jgi:uncharacterized protein with von Willebrand factor type A (vWA) domain